MDMMLNVVTWFIGDEEVFLASSQKMKIGG